MRRIASSTLGKAAVLAAITMGLGTCSPTIAAEPQTASQSAISLVESVAKPGDRLVATNNDYARRNAVLSLPVVQATQKTVVVEVTEDGEKVVPSEVDRRQPARIWWIAPGDFAPQAQRTFRVVEREAADLIAANPPHRLRLERNDRSLLAFHSLTGSSTGPPRAPWLQYNHAHVVPPADIPPVFGRNAYLHPLRTPSGRVVTDEYPPDHAHQSGVFLAYTKARFEDREPNFWELANKRGRVRYRSAVDYYEANPIWVEFAVEHEHVDETAPGGQGKVALLETWKVRIWNPIAKRTDRVDHWIFDIESRRRCATNQPLQLPQYHYGGMALRGARGWGGDKGQFTTSDGKDRVAGNHTRPRWCDLSGEVDGQVAGLALMTHPANFRYPEPLRIHPSMPYMVYTPSQLGDWEIAPGQEQVSRYRFVVHDGATSVPMLEHAWHEFAEPVVVSVEPNQKIAP
jgi:hypothetical protein